MSTPVRVRFAPSPTGLLHVGGIRSALFNYLWARHNAGAFILRIEDTDRARLVEDAEEQINASLVALGIAPDEGIVQGGEFGPYRQSERLEIYREHADKLLATGALYPCWCSAERLDGLRSEAQKAGIAFKYDRYCLDPANHKSMDEPHVLRFKIPATPESVSWTDAVRGELNFKTVDLDDFVAIKSDGYPTYQFANVVDDHLMEISHVLRADEWIPSTPKHLLVFDAFGWDRPTYAHLPAVQGPGGTKKLSKRDGAQSVTEYIDEGFLPEALQSFLASLGWNDGTTQEVYTPDELIQKFSLDRIQKSPARFDKERLTWINGYLIRQMAPQTLQERCSAFWPPSAASYSPEYRSAVLGLVQERLKYLNELGGLTDFFFETPAVETKLLVAQVTSDQAISGLQAVSTGVENLDWTEENLETAIRPLVESLGLKTGQLFGLVRVAITGRTAAPGLFETMVVLGAKETKKRLDQAKNSLKLAK